MNLTIAQKGFVLVLVPLLSQLAFVALVFRFQRAEVVAEDWAAHTKQVIAQARTVHSTVLGAHAASRGYVISRDPAFNGPYLRAVHELPGLFDTLDELVRDNPTQSARAASLRARAEVFFAWQGEIEHLVRGGDGEEAVARVRAGRGNEYLEDFGREVGALLAEEERLDRERGAALDRARARLRALVALEAGAALACTVALAYAFHRGITRRFATLERNVRRLAAREAAPPVGGADEIARLDRAFRDLTAELTRASDDVRDLYDNAPCGYHALAPDGTFLMINRTELGWLGYAAEEVVGRMKFPDLLTEASRHLFRENFSRFKRVGAVYDLEFEMVRKDGSVFPVLLNASSVRDPEGRYLRSRTTVTDITERKRAEAAVRQLSEGLEQRVRERTSELAEANRELTHRNAENEMFVYSVSHDLRGPLVNLQGFSRELEKCAQALGAVLDAGTVPPELRDRGRALLSGKMAQAIGFIRTAVLRLSGIIDALLRLSRAGRVEYRYSTVDVGRVVEQVVGAAQGTIAERGAVVRVGELPAAWGDRTAVEQVFANLVGNALTYLDPARPGTIDIGCLPPGAAGERDGLRRYYVRDNGLGIEPAHQQKIFQAFQRAHPGVGTGEGLGLAIVARVVERHRGRVWVESRPGEGSTFFVALPDAPSPPTAV